MNCTKCRLQRWYYAILNLLMIPVRKLAGGINIKDQVTATLTKNGEIIGRFVGIKMHNKWKTGADEGLNVVTEILRVGGSGTLPGKVAYMQLGSQCSDTGWTEIPGNTKSTDNTVVSNTQVKFTAEWDAAGAIDDICQAQIQMYGVTGNVFTRNAALYNFGTQFDKPDGVSLKIEWTTSLTS